jgi:putative endonuclease
MYTRKQFGHDGEQAVANLLEQKGFTILSRNYTVKGGEIDIIAADLTTVAFVEVKARRDQYFDSGQVIILSKQQKIIYAAKTYLSTHSYLFDKICRFDVALVEQRDQQRKITYIPHAFVENI